MLPPNNPVYGLNFGPDVYPGQDPGTTVPAAQVTSLLTTLRGYTQWIRTFGMRNGLQAVPSIAHQLGFKTAIGASIGPDPTTNQWEIDNLVAAAQAGDVDLAIVGNEVLLNNLRSEAEVITYIQSVKSRVPAGIPVTYVDTWGTLLAHPNLIAAVDIVAANIYPFWEGVPIDQALAGLQARYASLVQAANGKSVVIAETGWPSAGGQGSVTGALAPSLANATAYLSAVETWARSANIPLFYFEAFDEAWKVNAGDYASWGIFEASGGLKSGMAAIFQK